MENARSSRRSITSYGVSRSERLITAKSPDRGAPTREAAAVAAVTPGMIPTSRSIPARSITSSTMLAIPYTPGSPPLTIETTNSRARATHSCARSTSCPIALRITVLPARSGPMERR
jgi:hypothetical protein